MSKSYARELEVAVAAVARASHLCDDVGRALVKDDTLTKKDRSPVTVADFGAQAIIALELGRVFPNDPIVGEETTQPLREAGAQLLRRRVVESVRRQLPWTDEESVLRAIDACDDGGGATGRRWVVDPLDGTAGFLRREQYAIALALMDAGEVVLGVLGCPNLPAAIAAIAAMEASGVNEGPARGALFAATRGQGSYMHGLKETVVGPGERIAVSEVEDVRHASLCESVESSHSPHTRHALIAQRLGIAAPPVRMDSQCKYAAIARAEASIYLRLPTSTSYEEKIWDHAAGSIIVSEAGGEVTDVEGRPLDFTCGRTLKRNRGIVTTNARLHGRVLDAVSSVLGEDTSD